jgi:hypothetical protein
MPQGGIADSKYDCNTVPLSAPKSKSPPCRTIRDKGGATSVYLFRSLEITSNPQLSASPTFTSLTSKSPPCRIVRDEGGAT